MPDTYIPNFLHHIIQCRKLGTYLCTIHIGHEYLRVGIRHTFEFTSISLNRKMSNRCKFFY